MLALGTVELLWVLDICSVGLSEAQTIFYLTPAIVFFLTVIAAGWRFKIFRLGEPAIKMDIEVTSRRCSDSYNAVSSVAVITNTSRVVARCTELIWEVRVLAPYLDEDVASKINEYSKYHSVETIPVEFPWNLNYSISRRDSRIFLEPGEENTVSMSLAIPDWIKAIDVQLFLQASRKSKGIQTAWVAERTHDIVEETINGNQAG